MYTNEKATLFKLTEGKYECVFFDEVFWDEVKHANTIKSGMTVTDSVSLYIPYADGEELNLKEGKDFFYKGKIEAEIDNTSAKAQADSLKELRSLHGAPLTVTSFDKKLFGSKNMWHYAVSLK